MSAALNAEVPEGYKLTEVGVIPGDWEVSLLHEISEKIMVGIASAATHAYRDRGIVMFRNQNIKPGYLDDSDILYIAEEYEETFKNKRLKSGDLLTARTGYPGTTSIVPLAYEGAQSFTTLITRPRVSAIDPSYLCYFINSEVGQLFFEQNQIGGGQKNVNAGSLKQLPVPLPPTLEEQRAIATALSDVDALLAKLDQLIAKKQNLKQAAMQQLLTGQTRLPGFSGDWVLRPLASVVSGLEAGVSVNSVDHIDPHSSTEPCILKTSAVFDGNFDPAECKLIDRRDISRAKLSPRKDSIIISRMNTPNLVGEVGYVAQDFPNLNLPDRLWMTRFVSGADISARWLAYVMSSTQIKELIKGLATGTSGSMKNIAKGALLSLQLTFPPKAEQTAIATILSDLDAELAALQARQDKTRALKQGMMQALLTGRIRLV
ncbi:type I restriction enzyme S subunit [Polaromonas sp. CG_9.5]|uniref:restriction endonuclease subunit S n=1 Tax=Polaromonas sp. CG_9.5 TaxID=3071705 RepID=UPI002E02B59B|nr:type I restriction enzyme S subunit [Polaromonas sp. CG_9.5]